MDENKAFDVNFLFSNFDSPNDTNDEHQEAVHHKVKKLRKQANKKSTLEDEETEESVVTLFHLKTNTSMN